jgi:hypothetical protein
MEFQAFHILVTSMFCNFIVLGISINRPDSLFSNRGIVLVPTDSNSRSDFIEAISKNIVLILGKVD